MAEKSKLIQEMSDRSREVFRRVVEGYLASGDPVGSRTLTRDFSESVSAATIRNVMQDLEYMGLLDSPHVSAGRIPTQMGLRLFVDGLLEMSEPDNADREKIDATLGAEESDVASLLDRVGGALGFADSAVDAFVRVDHQHILALIEAVHRADRDAVGVFACDAIVGDDESHGHESLFDCGGHCRAAAAVSVN